uniref:Uncharacterized protein n=1 Tax=Macrostomum lignano TaxID=282301 RepID=A0A1I8JPM0_9PLAT
MAPLTVPRNGPPTEHPKEHQATQNGDAPKRTGLKRSPKRPPQRRLKRRPQTPPTAPPSDASNGARNGGPERLKRNPQRCLKTEHPTEHPTEPQTKHPTEHANGPQLSDPMEHPNGAPNGRANDGLLTDPWRLRLSCFNKAGSSGSSRDEDEDAARFTGMQDEEATAPGSPCDSHKARSVKSSPASRLHVAPSGQAAVFDDNISCGDGDSSCLRSGTQSHLDERLCYGAELSEEHLMASGDQQKPLHQAKAGKSTHGKSGKQRLAGGICLGSAMKMHLTFSSCAVIHSLSLVCRGAAELCADSRYKRFIGKKLLRERLQKATMQDHDWPAAHGELLLTGQGSQAISSPLASL